MKYVAILGCGVVGGGVARLFTERTERIARAVGEPVQLKYILERRDCSGEPWAGLVTDDFSKIENDPEVTVVCECMGGVGAALTFVRRCLKAGKSVVTSNKQLIAEYGLELLGLAKAGGCSLRFEAAVGGGIPLLRPLSEDLAVNRIDEVFGIVNGTTNYILTQMIENDRGFAEALSEAQALGYAEADPSADVDGFDAQRKLCILANLAFGSNLPPERVPAEGIRNVAAEDVACAREFGCAVKLIAHAERLPDDRITALVAPRLVDLDRPLASVNGVMNGVVVRGDAVGECLFYGAGAGRMPTASAVVGDALEALRHGDRSPFDWGEERPERFVDPEKLPFRWFVRWEGETPAGITEVCADGGHGYAGISPAWTRAQLDEATAGRKVLSRIRLLE